MFLFLIATQHHFNELKWIDPDVVPLDISGAVDPGLHDLTTKDMMTWALSNTEENSKEFAYAVRYRNKPVSTFGAMCNSKIRVIRKIISKRHFQFFIHEAMPSI